MMHCTRRYLHVGAIHTARLHSVRATQYLLATTPHAHNSNNAQFAYRKTLWTGAHRQSGIAGGTPRKVRLCSHDWCNGVVGPLISASGRCPGLPATRSMQSQPPGPSDDAFRLHESTGISMEEYRARRIKLMQALPPNSLVVVLSAPKKIMSNDIPFRYRQDSTMMYLTGFSEPEGICVHFCKLIDFFFPQEFV